ncbi:hypothetical protein PV08_08482 [Exophiala spinifera]|uniref:Oxidoreductase molybdopterin-binding domain-containing protein n=1 Tax=Exophiala spinifera TaxID=91928 RepID=A0A0D2BQ87_9EURO|nr:uncharacterized protein PV08_08482 [Exophiala spinifera]KIW13294.1 hypothetical protein PV08_08482 [Exophiala spinifera]
MTDEDNQAYSQHVTWIGEQSDGSERDALRAVDPAGFYIRPPPKPHELDGDVTDETQLFQTIHMGAAVVDEDKWKLVVDGLVERAFTVNLTQLRSMPRTTITSFHECYGSPVAPPTTALWRIGNVEWTGVRLAELLRLARPKAQATHVWSQGLDHGSFANVAADKYEKDLTLEKAFSPEVLVAFEMNGEPLTKNRGGPVRLVVPGWFGTNSTKWLCRLSLQDGRASGPFTTTFYNEVDPTDATGQRKRPVWTVEPNSMIIRPKPEEVLSVRRNVEVWGRAWGGQEIVKVDLSLDEGTSWTPATVTPRKQFEWQLWRSELTVDSPGRYRVIARATDKDDVAQPLAGRRNHVHHVIVALQ